MAAKFSKGDVVRITTGDKYLPLPGGSFAWNPEMATFINDVGSVADVAFGVDNQFYYKVELYGRPWKYWFREDFLKGRPAPAPLPPMTETQHEETFMNAIVRPVGAPAVEKVTKIFGIESKSVTDAQIYATIAELEGEVETLNQIQTKPKKLVAQIDSMKLDIQALADFVDAREDTTK